MNPWPDRPTELDLAALISLWGEETNGLQGYVVEAASVDRIKSLPGKTFAAGYVGAVGGDERSWQLSSQPQNSLGSLSLDPITGFGGIA